MATNNQTGRKLVPIKLDGYKPLRDVVFENLRDAIITPVSYTHLDVYKRQILSYL